MLDTHCYTNVLRVRLTHPKLKLGTKLLFSRPSERPDGVHYFEMLMAEEGDFRFITEAKAKILVEWLDTKKCWADHSNLYSAIERVFGPERSILGPSHYIEWSSVDGAT